MTEKNYVPVEDTIFKFGEVGEKVTGVLMDVSEGHFGNKVYKLKTENGDILTVFSTVVLESQMSSIKVGDDIQIEFTGIKKNPNTKLNDIKLFTVSVSK